MERFTWLCGNRKTWTAEVPIFKFKFTMIPWISANKNFNFYLKHYKRILNGERAMTQAMTIGRCRKVIVGELVPIRHSFTSLKCPKQKKNCWTYATGRPKYLHWYLQSSPWNSTKTVTLLSPFSSLIFFYARHFFETIFEKKGLIISCSLLFSHKRRVFSIFSEDRIFLDGCQRRAIPFGYFSILKRNTFPRSHSIGKYCQQLVMVFWASIHLHFKCYSR